MTKDITQEDLAHYEKDLAEFPGAEPLARAVQSSGVLAASKNHAAKQHLDRVFSVDLKTGKVANQKQSGRCWLFATLNTLRHKVAKKINVKDFEFSQNYNSFYDRLEKANAFLEKMIELADKPLDDRNVQWFLRWGDDDGGQWANAVALIEKYGLVPKSVMDETYTSNKTDDLNATLNRRLKMDALTLRKMVADGASDEDIQAKEEEFMSEVYRMLAFAFGKPVEKFDFEYRDDKKKYHIDRDLTPQEFFKKYVDINFDDYVCLTDAPDHEMGKLYSMPSQDFIPGGREIRFAIVDTEAINKAAAAQLKDGESVWFGCDVLEDMDRKQGILDPDYFKQDELFGLDLNFSKKDRLASGEGECSHAMTFTGVDLVDGKPTKWKVENSWGEKNGEKGYFIMTSKWFDDYTYEVIVNKKYLTDDQKAILKQDPTPVKPWDSLR